MSWDAEAGSLFPHTITIEAPGALNNYGRTTDAVGSGTSKAAYVEYKMRQVRNGQGEQTMSSIAVYISGSGGTSGITPLWTLTLPDGTTRPILSVNRFADEDGDLIEVAYLQ